ncbi:16S rRNA (cytidine(1402)-2'-O)-methyltransferase [Megalodesulfovibrio paquesii]
MLWIVATPIGNLGDISARALEILGKAEVVLAEDTRRTGMLFARLGLPSPRFLSFYEHNEESRIEQALALLEEGREVALVSDAGTPLLADPGYRLVRACRERGLAVSPVPGPSAILAALSASGLPPYPFVFLGFPPRKASERREMFRPYATLPATLVFFERGSRVQETLIQAREILGERECCVARELTKLHEEFILTSLDAWLATPQEDQDHSRQESTQDVRGEATVVIGPPRQEAATTRTADSEVDHLLAAAREAGCKPREAAKRVQAAVSGWTAKELYERVHRLTSD